ncbi:hypothetical protein PoB_002619600 [Plakobranchus ocellatus]|uniref:Uncharacterized protein n=1 Tax=Plakobranchus ocellatus TaxID=259542 RepID=A0AAV3ZUS2_9GAST|nr:hypothetical protein PoB_002619600 [Plakobranchus ocellatus]
MQHTKPMRCLNEKKRGGFKSNAAEPEQRQQPEFELHKEIEQLMSRLPDQDLTTPEDYISIDAEVLTSAPLTDEEIVA